MHTPSPTAAAAKLQQFLRDSSPLIEDYTLEVCPSCTDVCCKQKHGTYRERDIIYLTALNIPVPGRDAARPSEGPCEALGAHGCVHPRWQRPFKCTWYFCEPIIRAMEERPGRSTRQLTAAMEAMIGLYDQMKG
jgi:hypothetical protein